MECFCSFTSFPLFCPSHSYPAFFHHTVPIRPGNPKSVQFKDIQTRQSFFGEVSFSWVPEKDALSIPYFPGLSPNTYPSTQTLTHSYPSTQTLPTQTLTHPQQTLTHPLTHPPKHLPTQLPTQTVTHPPKHLPTQLPIHPNTYLPKHSTHPLVR